MAPEALAVQAGDKLRFRLDADGSGGGDPHQLLGQLAVLPGGVGGEQPGEGDLADVLNENGM